MTSLKALTTNRQHLIPYSLEFIQPQCLAFFQSEPANAFIAQIDGHSCHVPQDMVSTSTHLTAKVVSMRMLTEVHEPLVSVIDALYQSHLSTYFICLNSVLTVSLEPPA